MAAKLTTADSMRDALRWIAANPHHEGYWTGPRDNPDAFHLRGTDAHLKIPASVHVPGMMEPDDFRATGRMYRPSPAGRAALEGREDG